MSLKNIIIAVSIQIQFNVFFSDYLVFIMLYALLLGLNLTTWSQP